MNKMAHVILNIEINLFLHIHCFPDERFLQFSKISLNEGSM